MAGSINPGLNPNAVAVDVSKFIKNASHVGVAQQTGKETTQVKNDPPPVDTETVTTTAPPPPQDPPAPDIRGLQVERQPDGGQVWASDSGVKMSTDAQGKIQNIEVPGDGTISRNAEGQMELTTPGGHKLNVVPFEGEGGGFAGYAYQREDLTQVHVNLENMSVGYIGKDNNCWQEVLPDGSQLIRAKSDFKDPKTGERKQLETTLFVHPDGTIESEGYNRDLKVGSDKIQYKSPANFTHTIELPNSIPAFATAAAETPEAPAEIKAQTAAAKGPILMDEPKKPVVHAMLPNQVGFDRDEDGQTAIMLRSGLTLIHTKDSTAVRDPKVNDRLLPAEVESYTSADGRVEKLFRFKDAAGNDYRMFNDSMDFLVDSPDGKVRQHVLPGGTILGQVEGPNGQFYRFEVTPQGQIKSDDGLVIPPASGDKPQAFVPGADGKQVPVTLPYPIPADQANAGHYSNVFGTPAYPISGEKLEAFENGPPPAPPQTPPPPPPNQNQGASPNPSRYILDPTTLPRPGWPQQPVQPSFMQRMKYVFTGNPADLQPRQYYSPPPPWMAPYPPNYSMIYDPSMMVPNGPMPPYGDPSMDPRAMGPGAPGNPNGPAYPGSNPAAPGFTGQTPGYPGQMPDANTWLARAKADFDRTNQMMWGQVMMGQQTTMAMTMGQTMHSWMNGMNMSMAMWPRSMFYCPFFF